MSKESNADVGTLEWYPSTKGNDLNLVDLHSFPTRRSSDLSGSTQAKGFGP